MFLQHIGYESTNNVAVDVYMNVAKIHVFLAFYVAKRVPCVKIDARLVSTAPASP